MSPYRHLIAISLLLIGISPQVSAQSPIRARTEGGREIILYPDGTWKYVPETVSPNRPHARPSTARANYTPDRGDFVLWYDDTKWKLEKQTDGEHDASFRLLRSDGYAVMISEGIPIPTTNLKNIALANAKSASKDARLVSEEKRIVNGKEVLVLMIDGTLEQIPFRYYGYYYGGKQGSIQVVTYTSQNLFDKYKEEFIAFLNGLEIKN